MNEPNYTPTRQRDSVAVAICPVCQVRRYANQELLRMLMLIKSIKTERIRVNDAWLRHKPCNAVMSIVRLPKDIGSPVTADDLVFVTFEVQGVSTNAREATDAQFNAWITSRMAITGEDNAPWPLAERADACDVLVQRRELVVQRKKGTVFPV